MSKEVIGGRMVLELTDNGAHTHDRGSTQESNPLFSLTELVVRSPYSIFLFYRRLELKVSFDSCFSLRRLLLFLDYFVLRWEPFLVHGTIILDSL